MYKIDLRTPSEDSLHNKGDAFPLVVLSDRNNYKRPSNFLVYLQTFHLQVLLYGITILRHSTQTHPPFSNFFIQA